MAILPIRTLPDPVLKQKAKRVRNIDNSIRKLVEDMLETVLFLLSERAAAIAGHSLVVDAGTTA